jgi:hypothetical protein
VPTPFFQGSRYKIAERITAAQQRTDLLPPDSPQPD